MSQLAQVFWGSKEKSCSLPHVQRQVSFFLPNLHCLTSRAIPVIRLVWAEIIYHSFSHTLLENGYRAQPREIPPDRSQCQASRISVLVRAVAGLRNPFRVATIQRAYMHGNAPPGFLDCCPIKSTRHSFDDRSQDQFSHSIHDALRDYIPQGIKASPDFIRRSCCQVSHPSPANISCPPCNPLHPPVRP